MERFYETQCTYIHTYVRTYRQTDRQTDIAIRYNYILTYFTLKKLLHAGNRTRGLRIANTTRRNHYVTV